MPFANKCNFSLALRERVPEGRVRGFLYSNNFDTYPLTRACSFR